MLYEVITDLDIDAQMTLDAGDRVNSDHSGHQAPPSNEPPWRRLNFWSGNVTCNPRSNLSRSVITSYSIHYTKLYEFAHRDHHLFGELDRLVMRILALADHIHCLAVEGEVDGVLRDHHLIIQGR